MEKPLCPIPVHVPTAVGKYTASYFPDPLPQLPVPAADPADLSGKTAPGFGPHPAHRRHQTDLVKRRDWPARNILPAKPPVTLPKPKAGFFYDISKYFPPSVLNCFRQRPKTAEPPFSCFALRPWREGCAHNLYGCLLPKFSAPARRRKLPYHRS